MHFIKNHSKSAWGLAGLMCIFGLLGVLGGQDCNFDLMNYHFYNAHAFLFRPSGADIMPAGIHSFFNPLLDVPYYFICRWLENWPRAAAFCHSSVYGVYAFFIYKICGLFFAGSSRWDVYWKWGAFLTGITGAAGISQIGMSSGEIYEAALLAASLWLALAGSEKSRPVCWLSASVALAAAAFSVKYTAAPFCLGIAAAVVYLWYALRQPFRYLLAYAALGTGIVLFTDGWFWWRLWKEYANPLFPFYNAWFASPYFDAVNLIDRRFFPSAGWKWWLYPFYWMRETAEMGMEPPFADARWACAYVAFFMCCRRLLRKREKPVSSSSRRWTALVLFAGIGYLVWLRLFLILRYAVALEGITGVLVFGALTFWGRKTRAALACAVAAGFALTTVYPDWGKDPFASKVLEFDRLPALPERSLVLVQTQSLSYVLPFLNSSASFVGGLQVYPEDYPPDAYKAARRRNQLMPAFYAYHFEDAVREKISSHDGPVYLLTYYWPYALYPAAWKRWGLRGRLEDCTRFNSNWNKYFEYMILCPLEKLPADA